jgi:recombination protein RecT
MTMGRQPPSREVATVSEDAIQRFGGSYVVARRDSFERLLPANVDANTFVGLAMAALFKAPKTAEAAMNNPEALIIALRECAGLGLMPGTDEYALTVRKGQVAGIIQYQGHIKRMYNFGTVQSVHAEVIVRGERFIKQDPLPPIHDVADWNMRDTRVDIPPAEGEEEGTPNLVGAYAYAMLTNGRCSRVIHMGRSEIMRHRARAEMYAIWDGPFGASMWLKTVVHELEKWVPKSSEFIVESARVSAEMARRMVPPDPPVQTPRDAPMAPDVPVHQPDPVRASVDVGDATDAPPVKVPATAQWTHAGHRVDLPPDDVVVEDPPERPDWPETRRPPGGNQ